MKVAHQKDVSNEIIKLLLQADPNEELVRSYVNNSKIFCGYLSEHLVGVIVVKSLNDVQMEVMNISVDSNYQQKGYGKQLMHEAVNYAKMYNYKDVIVRTGNSSINQLAFYQKLKFRMVEIIPNYFIEHYEEPIFEEAIQCMDQIVLKLTLQNETI